MFVGKIYFCFCSDPVFHIRNKALAVATFLDVFVGRVPGNCWTDAAYWLGYRTWRDENFRGCAVFRHVCWFAEKKKQFFSYFKFLFSKGTSFKVDIPELYSTLPEICSEFL